MGLPGRSLFWRTNMLCFSSVAWERTIHQEHASAAPAFLKKTDFPAPSWKRSKHRNSCMHALPVRVA